VTADTVSLVGGVEELVPDDLQPTYATFIRQTYGEHARELGWTPDVDEDEDTRLLRPSLLGLVAELGEDETLVAEAQALARRWLEDRSAIDPQLVNLVLRVAALNGDETLWSKFYQQARSHTEEKERDYLFGAMGSFRSEELVRKNLDIILSGEFEIFEVAGLLFGALSEPTQREMAYAWVKENYDLLLAKLPRGYQSFLPRTAGFLCSLEGAEDAQAFFGPRVADIEGGPRALEQTLETLRLCSAYREAQRPEVAKFLHSL
jgi:alanyl aminopeptidase